MFLDIWCLAELGHAPNKIMSCGFNSLGSAWGVIRAGGLFGFTAINEKAIFHRQTLIDL